LEEHIHLHAIVTGRAFDGESWRESNRGFLFPVEELSQDFRDRFCLGLLKLYRKRKLVLVGKAAEVDVEELVERMQAKNWEVFIRTAFDNPEQVYEYLGRYVYKSAISNYRIMDITGRKVSFTYYDNADKRHPKDDGAEKVMTLDAFEFADKRHPLTFFAAFAAAQVSRHPILWTTPQQQAQNVGVHPRVAGVGARVAKSRGVGTARVDNVGHGRGSAPVSILWRGADEGLARVRWRRETQVVVLGNVGNTSTGEGSCVRWPREQCVRMGNWQLLRQKMGQERSFSRAKR